MINSKHCNCTFLPPIFFTTNLQLQIVNLLFYHETICNCTFLPPIFFYTYCCNCTFLPHIFFLLLFFIFKKHVILTIRIQLLLDTYCSDNIQLLRRFYYYIRSSIILQIVEGESFYYICKTLTFSSGNPWGATARLRNQGVARSRFWWRWRWVPKTARSVRPSLILFPRRLCAHTCWTL
jgi:hypothetical protein